MHSTPTLHIIVILSGQLEMRLDSGHVVQLQSGDSVIQRGAMRAWQVLGDEPCVTVGCMMQGEFRDGTP
jgi:quercetin dioxygenase-like cupin family protein